MKRLLLTALLIPAAALAADASSSQPTGTDFKLVISGHRFTPTEITIPANTKVRLQIENKDGSVEEFDSRDLNREKIITGKGKAVVFIGPLKPGRYTFQGEFHAETAQGVVIAK